MQGAAVGWGGEGRMEWWIKAPIVCNMKMLRKRKQQTRARTQYCLLLKRILFNSYDYYKYHKRWWIICRHINFRIFEFSNFNMDFHWLLLIFNGRGVGGVLNCVLAGSLFRGIELINDLIVSLVCVARIDSFDVFNEKPDRYMTNELSGRQCRFV